MGAAVFVVLCIKDLGTKFEGVLMGGRGTIFQPAKSAFHAEVSALDLATDFLMELAGH